MVGGVATQEFGGSVRAWQAIVYIIFLNLAVMFIQLLDDFPLRRLGAIESDDGVRVDVDFLAEPCPWRWHYKACQKWDTK